MAKKATSDNPLWLHKGTGQWAKKFRGVAYYFGADLAQALERYKTEWPLIEAGKSIESIEQATLSIVELGNAFLQKKRNLVDSGELSANMWSEYFAMAQRVTDTLGRNRAVADLRPGDFGRLRAAAAKDLGPIALGKFITMARSMFGFAHTADLIEKPVKFGDEFNKPTKKVLRGVRNARGERMISPADCRKLIETAKPQLAAMIYLALNCGFGQSDCAALQRATLAKRPGWIDFPRPKTGIERRCPLWPETIAALAAVEAIRPAPHNKDDADCVFLTRCGFRWVRFIDRGTKRVGVNIDSILQEFKKCAKDAKVKLPAGAFYTLRHVHRTIADATRDRAAIDLIMGHGDASMGAHYRERIDDERLQAVVDHVRAWLLETKPVDPKKPAAEDDDVDQASANVAIVGRPVLRLVG